MNVKLKEDGTLLPLAIVEDNTDLLLVLIREDLKAHKLAYGFNEIGCESPYLADLTDAVLDVAGFNEVCRTNELYNTYYLMMAKYLALLDGSDEVLARVVCTELANMKAARMSNKTMKNQSH